MTCSKGTYIRTLCHDIGQKLGCGGCMKELLRTRVERFGLEDSIRLGEIAQLQKEGILEEKIIAIDEMISNVCTGRTATENRPRTVTERE